MPSLTTLPVENLALILRFVNLNGDLAPLRLVSSYFDSLLGREQERYIQDICCLKGISRRTIDLYHDGHGKQESLRRLRNYLFFRYEVVTFEALDSHLTRICTTVHHENGLTPFLLFSAFTQMIKTAEAEAAASSEDVAKTGQMLQNRLNSGWKLSEVEHLISAINLCSSELWNLFPQLDQSEPTIEGHDFSPRAVSGTQQAVLTETVIRKGPKWATRVLLETMRQDALGELQWKPSSQLLDIGDLMAFSDRALATVVSEGLARMLWKERTAQIARETRRMEQERVGKVRITDLRVNAGVWRGSAGDM